MLTLDVSTLFYFNLSLSQPSQRSSGTVSYLPNVEEWSSAIPKNSRPQSVHTISSQVPSLTHSKTASQTSGPKSTRSALSNNVRVKTVPEEDLDEVEFLGTGAISDRNETIGKEAVDRRHSPVKNGRRVTSQVCPYSPISVNALLTFLFQAIVKVEVMETKPIIKKIHKATNDHFYSKVDESGVLMRVWSDKIIPSLIMWARCQRSPWSQPDKDLVNALKVLIGHFAPGVTVAVESPSDDARQLVSIYS
jgi:hypothetical protein